MKLLPLFLCSVVLLSACSHAPNTPSQLEDSPSMSAPLVENIDDIKKYALDQSDQMKQNTLALSVSADQYFNLIESVDFDYALAYQNDSVALITLVKKMRTHWLEANQYYELNEGIVAGVDQLADFDVWLDAGPSGVEDPIEARDWNLVLSNGDRLEKPGNFFHHLLEPALWGTKSEFVGLIVDDIVLPEAYVIKAAANGLDLATAEMAIAIDAWSPTLDEAFTILVVMVPTMNEYFEQWKLSQYVTGSESESVSFAATSRLMDINSILQGLERVQYVINPMISHTNALLAVQIETEFSTLQTFVSDIYSQEQSGAVFTPDQAEVFGQEAQDQASLIAGLITEAATEVGVEILQ